MSPSLLRQAAVDHEFRAALLDNPAAFGASMGSVPAAVQRPDQESLDFWLEGIGTTEIYACDQSCSWGPFTVVCDGTTK